MSGGAARSRGDRAAAHRPSAGPQNLDHRIAPGQARVHHNERRQPLPRRFLLDSVGPTLLDDSQGARVEVDGKPEWVVAS